MMVIGKVSADLHDLISCTQSFLRCCTVLLNTSDEDAHIISSCQPQAHAVPFLEMNHHRAWPMENMVVEWKNTK